MLERAGAEATRPRDVEGEYGLIDGAYRLSEVQAQAILDLRLHRLTGLEQEKIVQEYKDLLKTIEELSEILESPGRLSEVIRHELEEIRDQYGDDRRTEILQTQVDLTLEDLIPEETMVVSISHRGYIKRTPATVYRAQRRGGKGIRGAQTEEEDPIEHLFVASTHAYLLFFTNQILGQVARKHSQVEEQEIFDFWVERMELDDPGKFLPRQSHQ